jgi:hypothetical protein
MCTIGIIWLLWGTVPASSCKYRYALSVWRRLTDTSRSRSRPFRDRATLDCFDSDFWSHSTVQPRSSRQSVGDMDCLEAVRLFPATTRTFTKSTVRYSTVAVQSCVCELDLKGRPSQVPGAWWPGKMSFYPWCHYLEHNHYSDFPYINNCMSTHMYRAESAR